MGKGPLSWMVVLSQSATSWSPFTTGARAVLLQGQGLATQPPDPAQSSSSPLPWTPGPTSQQQLLSGSTRAGNYLIYESTA